MYIKDGMRLVNTCRTIMKSSVLFCVLLGITLSAGVQFQIKNLHGGPISVGIQGNSGHQHLEGGGFLLNQGQERTVNAPDNWGGRFWARTWCDGNGFNCKTGDCGPKVQCGGNGGAPPATLVEITLRGHQGQDFYDISLVDGFNSMAAIGPVGGRGSCRQITCKKNINSGCPNILRVQHDGQIIGCKSACTQEPSNDRYCCRNAYGTPQTCDGKGWPFDMDSATYFKRECPDAYSYAYDDQTSTFTCVADRYVVEFG